MEITVGDQSRDGLLQVKVAYYEQYAGKGWSAELNVWAPDSDSRAEIEQAARDAAEDFLRRMLAAHSPQDHREQSQ
ncbi:hypothetical protein CAI21_21605 [Alkalilimnicola ehrlichii]|uniref:Uncharacterized protein n=1 Tax=Alkalilimnicola ehrlichii TaxID=351052 RepID=A0A3E0WT42_9GAMM|nr:hypothetical protein [Alkalilimnicola ehrlichii]RFA24422.1 hypothetical protein CAI21_21605 [Alkalilimnicola ehrlichii]RFA35165.1 hypothetical protein CAL65_13760 [Alkalilimnicola ehrlichii]